MGISSPTTKTEEPHKQRAWPGFHFLPQRVYLIIRSEDRAATHQPSGVAQRIRVALVHRLHGEVDTETILGRVEVVRRVMAEVGGFDFVLFWSLKPLWTDIQTIL